jgi:peptidyl-prolyl cis-trans isomerase C
VKKTTTILFGLALVATVAMAQDTPAAKPATTSTTSATTTTATTLPADAVVISAGDVKVTRTEFENALKTLPAEAQQYYAGPAKRQLADEYLRMKLLAQLGLKNNLQNDPDVQQQLALMRENLVANAQLQRIEKSISLSDADLQSIYNANKSDYEQVKAKHILIAFKGSPAAQQGKPELTDEQAKAKAQEIKNQIAAGKLTFEDAAKKNSDDTGSGANGGDLGTFGRGQMVPEFEAAAFQAKPGDVIGPVRTQFGYHVIKVESHEFTPFENVKSTIEKKEHQKRMQAQLDALKAQANPVYNEAYFPPPPAPAAEASGDSAHGTPATAAAPVSKPKTDAKKNPKQ